SRPAVRDLWRTADELMRECLQPRLNPGRRPLLGCRFLLERAVAGAAEDEPQILGLLPVVVAVTGVVRAGEVLLAERLRNDDLSASRLDNAIEPLKGAVRLAVSREHDPDCAQLVRRPHGDMLADLGSRLRGPDG